MLNSARLCQKYMKLLWFVQYLWMIRGEMRLLDILLFEHYHRWLVLVALSARKLSVVRREDCSSEDTDPTWRPSMDTAAAWPGILHTAAPASSISSMTLLENSDQWSVTEIFSEKCEMLVMILISQRSLCLKHWKQRSFSNLTLDGKILFLWVFVTVIFHASVVSMLLRLRILSIIWKHRCWSAALNHGEFGKKYLAI